MFFDTFNCAIAIVAGLIVGTAIGKITEVYTSADFKSVKKIAEQSQTGSATTIISGFGVGMLSTVWPIIFVAVGILVANAFAGLYGIALAAVGMLSTTGMVVAVDAYGPVSDNAGGIAEMSELPHEVRNITDKLDSVGTVSYTHLDVYKRQEEEARKLEAEKGYIMKEDAGRGWRRVVASPLPKKILEINTVRRLWDSTIVVTAGGGGTPVVVKPDGSLEGVAAVIDKDFAAELLAEDVDADGLMILYSEAAQENGVIGAGIYGFAAREKANKNSAIQQKRA